MTRRLRPRPAVLLPTLLLLAGALACGPSEQVQEEALTEIEELLEAYLPRLTEVYTTGDLTALEGLAAPREINRVETFIRERAQEGQVVDPELERFEIEDVNLYQHSNAFVTTREIWNLRLRAAGSDRLISEELGKSYRYRYQIHRDDGDGWTILAREVIAPPAGG